MSATTKRTTKMITDQEIIDRVVNIKPEEITSSFIVELFGDFDGKKRANPYDLITVPKGGYGIPDSKRGVNTKPFVTGIGRYIWNKMYIQANPTIFEEFGYIDENVSKGVFNKLYKKIGYLKLEDQISLKDFKRFAMTTQLTMSYVQFISPSYTDAMLLSSKPIGKEKEKLLKANKAALDAKDIKAADAIQKELMEYSKELLKDDPSMDTFDSGAGGSFSNNFKNMFIMKGTVRDPDPTKGYNIVTSNYIDGVSVDEYATMANTLAEGPFNRSKKTEVGGWWEKLFVYSLQHLKLLPAGSDCGTKRYIEVSVTKDNIDDIMYCYMIESSGKLTEITSKNRDSIIGKRIKLRFSSLCEAKNGCFCNMCAGNLWYRLGITNVGVITPQIPSKLKNTFMKSFHDSQVSLTDMNVMEAFCPDEVLTESADVYLEPPRP